MKVLSRRSRVGRPSAKRTVLVACGTIGILAIVAALSLSLAFADPLPSTTTDSTAVEQPQTQAEASTPSVTNEYPDYTSDPARAPSEQAARLADQMASHFAAADLVVRAATQVADPKNPSMEFGLVARDSDKRFVNVIVYTSSGDSLPRDAISGGRPSEDVSIAGTTQAILVELPKQEAWQIVALLPDRTVINIISGQSPQLGVEARPPLDRDGVLEAVEVLMGLMEETGLLGS